MGDLETDTRVEGGNGRYTASPQEGWRIWGPMGGYVASIALRAAAAELVGDLLPASFTCQFFAPAEFRPSTSRCRSAGPRDALRRSA